MGNFYCLMTGLPTLSLNEAEKALPVASIKELIEEEQGLSEADRKIIFTFFLEGDCRNLLSVLQHPELELPQVGNYTREELNEMIEDAQDDMFEDDPRFPAFMPQFVREYNAQNGQKDFFAEDAIMLSYWEYAQKAKSSLVSEWAKLNLNISNLLTALIARQQNWNISSYIKGENEVNETILSSKAKDFDLGREYDYVSQLMQIVECENPVEKERRIDALKWLWLDDQTFFDTFSTDAVYAYLCKTQMLERWYKLDPARGKERFETIIENLRGEAKVPDEFLTYSNKLHR